MQDSREGSTGGSFHFSLEFSGSQQLLLVNDFAEDVYELLRFNDQYEQNALTYQDKEQQVKANEAEDF